jgi:hypothetical protein
MLLTRHSLPQSLIPNLKMKYRLRSISTLSIARFGCLLGWIVTVIPSLTCGLVGWRLAVATRDWLEGWEHISLDLLGFDYTLDLIDILQLQQLLAILHTVESRALPLLAVLMIVTGIIGAALIAITLIVLGWGYNLLAWLTGGVVVELQEIPGSPTQRQ